MTTLLDQISNQIPSGIREVLLGNSRQDLLNRVTDTLVLFGDELLHADSERRHRIAPAARSSTEGNIDAAPLLRRQSICLRQLTLSARSCYSWRLLNF